MVRGMLRNQRRMTPEPREMAEFVGVAAQDLRGTTP
jgi:hypothetical protein